MWHHESVSRRSRPLDSIACAPAATTSISNRTLHPPQPPPAAKRTPGWVGWRPPDKTTACTFCLRRFSIICTYAPTGRLNGMLLGVFRVQSARRALSALSPNCARQEQNAAADYLFAPAAARSSPVRNGNF